jgi:hypothetical protein
VLKKRGSSDASGSRPCSCIPFLRELDRASYLHAFTPSRLHDFTKRKPLISLMASGCGASATGYRRWGIPGGRRPFVGSASGEWRMVKGRSGALAVTCCGARSPDRRAMVERAFRCLKTVDLQVRPIHHWLKDRVHAFLCMLAYRVAHAGAPRPDALGRRRQGRRHRQAAAEALRETPVSRARRSPAALAMSATGRTDDGAPVHFFQTLSPPDRPRWRDRRCCVRTPRWRGDSRRARTAGRRRSAACPSCRRGCSRAWSAGSSGLRRSSTRRRRAPASRLSDGAWRARSRSNTSMARGQPSGAHSRP